MYKKRKKRREIALKEIDPSLMEVMIRYKNKLKNK